MTTSRVTSSVDGRGELLRLSIASAFDMSAFQISAGNVPPATDEPLNSVGIGMSLSG